MTRTRITTLLAAAILAAVAYAVPVAADDAAEKFQRTGRVDAVSLTEKTVTINDIPYVIADDAVVHTLTAKNVSLGRIRAGVLVGYRLGGKRNIVEFWLLPNNYKGRNER